MPLLPAVSIYQQTAKVHRLGFWQQAVSTPDIADIMSSYAHAPTELSRLSGSSAATCASADALLLAALGGAGHLCCAANVGANTWPPDGHAALTACLLPMPQLPRAPPQQLAAVGRASLLPVLMSPLHLLVNEAAEAGVGPSLADTGVADHGMHDCRLQHALTPGGGCIWRLLSACCSCSARVLAHEHRRSKARQELHDALACSVRTMTSSADGVAIAAPD
jgi:hypothetical protein